MFTDIRMPKMDGIELVEAMQKLDHRPLTVAISGYDDFAYAVQLLRMGVKEYILKPVEREQIVEILKKLEEEIQKKNESDRETREIGCQQLKYMILNEHITDKEIQTVTQRFEKKLLSQEYVVCCLESSGEETQENASFLCLGDIEGNCVYIIERENKEFLLKNELADSYVGISRLHSGVVQLKEAYAEARMARKEAFLRAKHEVEYTEALLEERGKVDEEKIHQIVQMVGTDKISGALKIMELFFGEIQRERYSGSILEKSIYIFIEEMFRTYQNVLQGEEQGLLKLQNIYQFANLDELMEELTDWLIGFHKKIHTEFDDYRNKEL